MRIVSNIAAMNTHRVLTGTDSAMNKNLEKLSSGLRINRAADDAAGLAITEKMKNQISGLNVAARNAQDAISLIQTAEGALTETHSILNRMRDLTLQAKNGSYAKDDQQKLDTEFKQLLSELGRISTDIEFNKKTLLNGDFSGAGNEIVFQVGANQGQTIGVNVGDMSVSGMGMSMTGKAIDGLNPALGASGLALVSNATGTEGETLKAESYDAVLGVIDGAIDKVSEQRANLGAVQNRLEHTINSLNVTAENLSASKSRISEVDMAQEMTAYTKNQILIQSATAMLAQANTKPQSVLNLLS